jgi:hypothetical protein
MAAVVKGDRVKPIIVPGYEVVDTGVCAEAWVTGDQLVNTAAGWVLCPDDALEAHGMAMKPAYVGQRGCDILMQGEMAGFEGLIPGEALYPSTTVPGGLDTTPTVGGTIRVRARTTTSVRVNYV